MLLPKGWKTVQQSPQFGSEKAKAVFKQTEAECYEKMGFTVLKMSEPEKSSRGWIEAEPDRVQYVIWAYVRRKPEKLHFDIPDAAVPMMISKGLKLEE